MISINPPEKHPLDRPPARRGNPNGFRDANQVRRRRAKHRAFMMSLLTIRLCGGGYSASAIARIYGTSRDAVYAARYRYRRNYPKRPKQGLMGIKYIYTTVTPSPTS